MAACIRGHGVPNFPDPDNANGAFDLSGVDRSAPQYQAALASCQSVTGFKGPMRVDISHQGPESAKSRSRLRLFRHRLAHFYTPGDRLAQLYTFFRLKITTTAGRREGAAGRGLVRQQGRQRITPGQ